MASSESEEAGTSVHRKQVSLYDATAGRVGYEGFLTEQRSSRFRDTAITSAAPVPPEEVLFRKKGAPSRYEEDDVYSADRQLQTHQRLPESDVLKTIHAYAADYYAGSSEDDNTLDFRSMDETALLAMGILLEEAAVHHLGSSGDLSLIERSNDHGNDGASMYWYDGQRRRKVVRSGREVRGAARKPR